MTADVMLDCQSCGACCHGDDGWVHVDGRDEARVEASAALAKLVVFTRPGNGHVRRSLRMIGGRCAALAKTKTGVTCTIYADRPSICREVEAGSEACLAARARRADL